MQKVEEARGPVRSLGGVPNAGEAIGGFKRDGRADLCFWPLLCSYRWMLELQEWSWDGCGRGVPLPRKMVN